MLFRVAIVLSLCFASSAFGEDPLRGRLPDGRAFRTDGGGNQIVDYIAELELTVEQLNRRVHGLEDEVLEKRELLTRLNKGDAPAPFRERTVETSAKVEPPALVVPASPQWQWLSAQNGFKQPSVKRISKKQELRFKL
jgi:hypothetical protein